MQQRYYDPGIGRFLSVDPVTADAAGGTNFNRYWYANNNPYAFTDPDGRQSRREAKEQRDREAFCKTGCDSGSWWSDYTTRVKDSFAPITNGPRGNESATEWLHRALCNNHCWDGIESVLSASPGGSAAAGTSKFLAASFLAIRLKQASKFGSLAYSSAGIAPYSVQRLLTAGQGGAIQAHHLIEKRFANVLGGNTDNWASIVVTRAEHQQFTNAWSTAIPHGAGTRNASRAQIESAARKIYAGYPEILNALGL